MIRPPPSPRVVQYTRTLTVRIIHCLFLLIYIVPEKPLWGGNNEVVYVCVLCNPCYDPYGSYGLKNGIQFVKGRLRSVTCISLVGQERHSIRVVHSCGP